MENRAISGARGGTFTCWTMDAARRAAVRAAAGAAGTARCRDAGIAGKTSSSTTSQMVAVYDVVEIAGISYGMISKTSAYDLNRNHTM